MHLKLGGILGAKPSHQFWGFFYPTLEKPYKTNGFLTIYNIDRSIAWKYLMTSNSFQRVPGCGPMRKTSKSTLKYNRKYMFFLIFVPFGHENFLIFGRFAPEKPLYFPPSVTDRIVPPRIDKFGALSSSEWQKDQKNCIFVSQFIPLETGTVHMPQINRNLR